MSEEVLVDIKVSRKNGEIVYKVDCAKEVTSEELAHYLDEIIDGICAWKPEVCSESVERMSGTIKTQKTQSD